MSAKFKFGARQELLQTMRGFSIFLREVLVIRSPILFISGISEFGPDFSPTGKRSSSTQLCSFRPHS
ncbi:hypothetical protein LEP1GSC051_1924 [Leptospira sp. P2653]|nr:hypothetical protein LEP1GSC051_1924 [Leptospira sp. P2653]